MLYLPLRRAHRQRGHARGLVRLQKDGKGTLFDGAFLRHERARKRRDKRGQDTLFLPQKRLPQFCSDQYPRRRGTVRLFRGSDGRKFREIRHGKRAFCRREQSRDQAQPHLPPALERHGRSARARTHGVQAAHERQSQKTEREGIFRRDTSAFARLRPLHDDEPFRRFTIFGGAARPLRPAHLRRSLADPDL